MHNLIFIKQTKTQTAPNMNEIAFDTLFTDRVHIKKL